VSILVRVFGLRLRCYDQSYQCYDCYEFFHDLGMNTFKG
jgi:hypothetical protein